MPNDDSLTSKRWTVRQRAVLGSLVSLVTALIVVAVAFVAERWMRRERPAACAQVDNNYARDFRRLAPCMKKVRRGDIDYLVGSHDHVDATMAMPGFPLKKTPRVKRIVVLGESSGALFGGTLQQLLLQSCQGKFEVMNCADTAGALEDVERKWEEVREYEPDVTVLVFGHNLSFERPQGGVWLTVESVAAKSCVAVNQLGFQARGITEGEMPERLSRLDTFLNRLGREAKASGSALVVNTMAGNLWKVPMPASPEALLETRYLSAARGRPAAIEHLRRALTSSSGPMVDFLLGDLLAREGQLELARSHALQALEKDTDRSRAIPAVNDRIRRFAAETGALLRDTEKALAETAPGRLPGWESFIDNCHLTPRNVEHETRAVSDLFLAKWPPAELGNCPGQLRAMPAGFSSDDKQDGPMLRTLRGASNLCRSPSDSSWCLSLELAVERRLRADFAETDAIVRSFLVSEAWRSSASREPLPHIAAGYDAAGYPARAQELLQEAGAEKDASVWAQRGLFELAKGQPDDAAKSWARAVELDSQHPAATYWLRRLQEERRGNR